MVLISEDLEKRSFSAPVPADETNFFPGRNGDGYAIEEGLVAVSEAEFVCREKSHRLRVEG